MPARNPIAIGTRFARLVVITHIAPIVNRLGHNEYMVRCQCECGQLHDVRERLLKGGKTRSCGCLNRESYMTTAITHGLSKSPEYRVWNAMTQRCMNPKTKPYKNYGGRGITVCERWLKFSNFYADMGPKPKGMFIERINNNKGYCKDNCRWATKKEQCRNMRRNVFITFRGITACLAEMSERFGIKYSVLKKRVESGWSSERTMTEPVQGTRCAPCSKPLPD